MSAFKLFKSKPNRKMSAHQSHRVDSKITLVIIPAGNGISRRISVSRNTLWAGVTGIMGLIGAMGAFTLKYFELKEVDAKLAELQLEHESIRSEASALYTQLRDVQSNLNQVDNFSNQVREATKVDEKNPRPESSKDSTGSKFKFINKLKTLPSSIGKDFQLNIPAAEGIGPISKEEYEKHLQAGIKPQNLVVAAKVKQGSLEFGSIFDELNAVKEQSSDQIDDLTSLLTEVQQYRIRIDQTPTISPVEGRLTSHFGYRESPINGKVRLHRGLDIAAPLGSPIRAAAAGIVVRTGRAADYGKFVELAHGHKVITVYAHAQQILVKKGDQVHKGQKIALVGMTGRTTGPHLHYEVRIVNNRVNPANYISFNKQRDE